MLSQLFARLRIRRPIREKQRRVTTELAEERNRFVADEVLIAYAHPSGKMKTLARELLRAGKRVYTSTPKATPALVHWGQFRLSRSISLIVMR